MVTNKRAKAHAGNNFLVGNVADDGSDASGPAGRAGSIPGQSAAVGELPIQGNLMAKGGSGGSETTSPTPNQFDLSMHSTISL